MPLSPELGRLPGFAVSFYRAGLFGELATGVIKGETGRNLVEDARKLMKELERNSQVEISGLENIPKEGGSMIVFNHPNNNVLLPAMLEFLVKNYDLNGQQVKIAIVSELTLMSASLNQKTALPGSSLLLKRFHQMYADNIISVPTVEKRKDYLTGRSLAMRKLMRAVLNKEVVIISPEGHVEKEGKISPVETYHKGSGKLAILATKRGVPTVPMGIWEEGKTIQVVVGEPFFMTTQEADLAAIEAMFAVAKCLPPELRGPFK